MRNYWFYIFEKELETAVQKLSVVATSWEIFEEEKNRTSERERERDIDEKKNISRRESNNEQKQAVILRECKK